jgi:membrane protease YdiL (CAAX protease family)
VSQRWRRDPRISALLFYAAVSVAAIAGTIAASILSGRHPDPAWAWLLKCIVIFALIVGLTALCLRRAGTGWKRYGVFADRSVFAKALAGLAAGLALACIWAVIVWLWEPYELSPNPEFSLRAFAFGTLATVLIGVAEEVGYRTYGLELLETAFGPAAAVLLPSLLFAAMHTTGGMPWLAAICVVGSCSVLYGTLMLATRSLPLVAAFHVANNLLQDAVIRTGDGSVFKPTFDAPPGHIPQTANIWLSMMAVNLVVAGLVWRKRRSGFPASRAQSSPAARAAATCAAAFAFAGAIAASKHGSLRNFARCGLTNSWFMSR